MQDKLAIIGYSGHAFVLIEAAILNGYDLAGYCDKIESGNNYFQLPYLGDENSMDFDWTTNYNYIIGIGDNNIRKKIVNRIPEKGTKFINVIHPRTNLSSSIIMGTGNFINAGVVINALASLGNHCIINTGAIIEHECKIGDFVHIAPGAVLAGNVTIGDSTFIGANAVIKQGVKIGNNAIVGAGSVVINDIADGLTVVGNPSKTINKNG